MYLFSIYQIARFQRLTDLSFCFVVGFKFEKFMNSRTSLKGMVWSKIQKYFIYLKMFFVKKQLQQSIFEHRKLFITALKDWSFCLLFTAVFWTRSAYVTPAPSYDENIKEKKSCFACFEILRVVKVKFIYCLKMSDFEYLSESSCIFLWRWK